MDGLAIRKVGVIGAGQMGNGIAHVVALAGYDVVMSDVSLERAEAAMEVIARNMDRQIHRGIITPDQKTAALARITPVGDLAPMKDADLVIEAATEK